MPGPTFFNPPFSVLHPTNNSFAVGVISTNKRAYTAQGPMATQGDMIIFPLPVPPARIGIGMWTVANRRTYVNGVATVGQTSAGIAVTILAVPPGLPKVEGPIYPTVGAPRVHTR